MYLFTNFSHLAVVVLRMDKALHPISCVSVVCLSRLLHGIAICLVDGVIHPLNKQALQGGQNLAKLSTLGLFQG